jgi:hypothetical protein
MKKVFLMVCMILMIRRELIQTKLPLRLMLIPDKGKELKNRLILAQKNGDTQTIKYLQDRLKLDKN